jgi:hypothetical protein
VTDPSRLRPPPRKPHRMERLAEPSHPLPKPTNRPAPGSLHPVPVVLATQRQTEPRLYRSRHPLPKRRLSPFATRSNQRTRAGRRFRRVGSPRARPQWRQGKIEESSGACRPGGKKRNGVEWRIMALDDQSQLQLVCFLTFRRRSLPLSPILSEPSRAHCGTARTIFVRVSPYIRSTRRRGHLCERINAYLGFFPM